MRIRRRRFCHLEVRDAPRAVTAALLRGALVLDPQPMVELLCPLAGRRIALDAPELAALVALPAERWLDLDEASRRSGEPEALLRAMVDKTALLGDHAAHRTLVAAEARLAQVGWHPLAALYHRHSRWSGVAGDEASREHTPAAEAERLAAQQQRRGPLPPHFVRHEGPEVPLTLPAPGALESVLARRETVRRFQSDRPLSRADFEAVLHGSFGLLGIRELGAGMAALKRTSPSGGGLTAIEPYVLVLAVADVPPGLYHYRAESHALTLLEALDVVEARRRLTSYCAGQAYFGDAHAAILHVARFDRHFWKYLRHGKAYKAVLMESAHLSQTLYLLAAARGLGAWYTAILNDADIATDLGLDGIERDAVAISGFGLPDPARRDLSFEYRPWDPLASRVADA
jgi:putative peptide maturation dehydrogenase